MNAAIAIGPLAGVGFAIALSTTASFGAHAGAQSSVEITETINDRYACHSHHVQIVVVAVDSEPLA